MDTRTLCSVGNSRGIIIDKALQRLLGIGPKTKFRVTTDGRRIILEPLTQEPPALTASELDAAAVFRVLVDRFDMGQERFNQLTDKPMRLFAYPGWLKTELASRKATHHTTLRRFEACLRALRQGASWTDAITVALHSEPKLAQPSVTPQVPHHATADEVAQPSVTPEVPHDAMTDEPIQTARLDESLHREDVDDENPPDGVSVSLD